MRHPRSPRPAILALLALLASATLLVAATGYTIILKDGSSLVAKKKYTIENGRAIITLLSGSETFVAADKIDVARTEAINKSGYGTGVLIPGSPQDIGTVPAQPKKEETLADLINKRGAGPRDVPTYRREKDQPVGGLVKTKAGYYDLSTLARKPYPHADVTAELQQFFHAQGLDEVEILEGTQADRPLVEISTNSEGSVFKALGTAANALIQVRNSAAGRVAAFEVLLTTPARERAGQFVLTPEMAAELVAKKVDVTAFFVRNVQF
jgi:hypothetical protein